MASRLRFFLMPGRLTERAVWVRTQRAIAWFVPVLAAVGYVLVMIKLLA